MRREKEIAESRYEIAQGESLRYRLRVEHLERELTEVQDSLSAARERMQVCSYTFVCTFCVEKLFFVLFCFCSISTTKEVKAWSKCLKV